MVAAAAAALDPEDVEVPQARLRRALLTRPQRAWLRALRGVAAVALGVFVVLSPQVALQLAALLIGAYLVFFGTSELLALLQRRGVARVDAQRRRWQALTAAATVALAAVAAAVAVVLVVTDSDEPARVDAASGPDGERRCNGSIALCDLRLNEAVFAGTHNSFSAADSPGLVDHQPAPHDPAPAARTASGCS